MSFSAINSRPRKQPSVDAGMTRTIRENAALLDRVRRLERELDETAEVVRLARELVRLDDEAGEAEADAFEAGQRSEASGSQAAWDAQLDRVWAVRERGRVVLAELRDALPEEVL